MVPTLIGMQELFFLVCHLSEIYWWMGLFIYIWSFYLLNVIRFQLKKLYMYISCVELTKGSKSGDKF